MALPAQQPGGQAQPPPAQNPGLIPAIQQALGPKGAVGGNPIVQGAAQGVQSLEDKLRAVPGGLQHAIMQILQKYPASVPAAPGPIPNVINAATGGVGNAMERPAAPQQ